MGEERDDLATAIAAIPAVDAHCHPFVPSEIGRDLAAAVTLSESDPPPAVHDTIMVRRLQRDLAAFLGCDPDPVRVAEARAAALAVDPERYVASLFDDANVDVLLCDVGHPVTEAFRPAIELADFEALVQRRCRMIVRLNTAVYALLREGLGFDEFLGRLDIEVADAVRRGAVGFKSTVAYETGLDVEIVGRDAARVAYEAAAATGDPELPKPLADYLFLWGLERAITYDIPIQVHTGMGDGPIFDMNLARPALLRRVLFDPAWREARIVLTHAGYPWVEESGWMANQYDNVFIDVSEMVPFAAHGVTEKVLGLLELAPTSKLMFGSDGFNVPEIHWFGAHVARGSIVAALRTLVADGWLGESDALDVAREILRDNAFHLYRLDRSTVAGPTSTAVKGGADTDE